MYANGDVRVIVLGKLLVPLVARSEHQAKPCQAVNHKTTPTFLLDIAGPLNLSCWTVEPFLPDIAGHLTSITFNWNASQHANVLSIKKLE